MTTSASTATTVEVERVLSLRDDIASAPEDLADIADSLDEAAERARKETP